MAMTRRDFVAIASAIRTQIENDKVPHDGKRAVARAANEMANHCKRTNSAFRFDTFFEACGLDKFGDLK